MSYAKPAQMIDPTSPALPTEPIDDLFKLYDIPNLKPFDEKFALNQEACAYLKKALSVPSTRNMTLDRCCGLLEEVEERCTLHVQCFETRHPNGF